MPDTSGRDRDPRRLNNHTDPYSQRNKRIRERIAGIVFHRTSGDSPTTDSISGISDPEDLDDKNRTGDKIVITEDPGRNMDLPVGVHFGGKTNRTHDAA